MWIRGAIVAVVLCLTGAAEAKTIRFDEFATEDNANDYAAVLSGGLLFDTNGTTSNDLLVWGKRNEANADPGGATLSSNFTDLTAFIRRADGGLFDFNSIDLADIFNGQFGPISTAYRFSFSDGTQRNVTINGSPGLKTFVFDKKNIRSITIDAQDFQIDNLNVDFAAPVPEPATCASLAGGLALAGGIVRRRRVRADRT